MDDALDYLAEAEEAGKPVGHDLEEGKITLPLIHAMHQDEELTQRVADISERDGYEGDDRQWIRSKVHQHQGTEYTMQRASDYAQRAKALLPESGDTEILKLLKDLADFSAQRMY
jgi:octaprenyl-diphosphate synthase